MPETQDRKGLALILLCVVQFMVVLDIAIVNVALPTIKTALDFKETDLQWVINAYTLTFGGLLLLGGRSADLLGRRRMFLIGLALFSGASLACGLATSETPLIAARAVQGVGAAIISPAALSILMTTFQEGAERNKALGIWGAIAGTGGAAGVLLGGVLTDQLNWSWIFYINVPVGLLVIALGPRILRESRVEAGRRSFDLLGAVLVTGGLSLLVYALVQTVDHSWSSPRTIAMFVGAAALLGGFVATETRAARRSCRCGIFRNRSLAGANVVGLMLGASIFSMFFLLTLYMQQVLGYSALKTGVGYLLVSLRDHRVGRRLAGARHQDRRAHGARRRDGAHRCGPCLLQPGLGRRLLSGRPGAGLHPDRRRPRLLVRAGHDRGARRRRAGRGGHRLGHHQHVAAGRRRARARPSSRRLRSPRRPTTRSRTSPRRPAAPRGGSCWRRTPPCTATRSRSWWAP